MRNTIEPTTRSGMPLLRKYTKAPARITPAFIIISLDEKIILA
jgi:hypothetical protein